MSKIRMVAPQWQVAHCCRVPHNVLEKTCEIQSTICSNSVVNDATSGNDSIDKSYRTAIMKRVGFQFKVRQDRLAEYTEHHKHVWPEMLEALRETGWHNYTLFLREDGLIFGYFETEETLAVAQAKMTAKDVNTRW